MDTRHPSDEALYAFVEAQLPDGEAARIAEHIAVCGECGALVADARGVAAAASGIVGALDSVPGQVVPRPRPRRLPAWSLAAAGIVLAVGVSSVLARSVLGPGTRSQLEAVIVGSERPAAAEVVAKEQPARAAAVTDAAASVSSPPAAAVVVESGGGPPPPPIASAVVTGRVAAVAPAPPTAERPTGDARTFTAARAQGRVTLSGRVVTEDGRPLAGAGVFINELNVSVGTDSAGRYELVVPPGVQHVNVRARAIGFAPESRLVAPGAVPVDFTLRPERMALSEVVVTSGRAENLRRDGAADSRVAVATEAELSASAAPLRVVRYRVRPDLVIELQEFGAAAPPAVSRPGINEFRWQDPGGSRSYVLRGALSSVELEALAHRLAELTIVR